MTWQAALIISACYYLSQSAWLAGLGFWTLYRPLVGGFLVGLVLGDPLAGARVGAAINLAYLGFLATGGALPTDISLAGYLGTALALVGGLDERTALALTLPVGWLGYLAYQLRMTLDVAFVHQADRAASRGSAAGVAFYNVGPPQLLLLALSMLPCFIAVYYGPDRLSALFVLLPVWLLGMLDLIGGLLPAVGIAMSLAMFWHHRTGAFFILGFVLFPLVRLPLLTFGILVSVVAWLVVRAIPTSTTGEQAHETTARHTHASVDQRSDHAPENSRLLRPRDLLSSWVNWLFFSHACYSYERMQGPGFAHAMVPVLRRLYPERERLAEGLQRHLAFYNAEPNVGALVNGVVVALEEARARGEAVSAELISATKSALMGPISGLGDTLIQSTVAPVLLSLGIGLVQQGSVLGPLLYAALIAPTIWGIGWVLFRRGYREGRARLVMVREREALQPFLEGAEIVGSSVLGALAATAIQLRTPLVLRVGQVAVRVQEDLLDKIVPQMLPLGLVLTCLVLLRRRVRPSRLVLGLLLFGLAARLLGVL